MVSIVFMVALFAGVCHGAPSRATDRIVGGTPATILQYPSAVQVNDYVEYGSYWAQICGGSILTQNIVISAAHCFVFEDPNYHSVRAGATIRNRGGTIGYISNILIHPAYGVYEIALDADIAIARLRYPLFFGDAINYVSILPQDFVIPGNSPGIYAGWGFNYEETDVLRHVNVNIVSHDECERRWGGPIHQDVVCAGYDGTDACTGDSGGPLYYQGILAGLVSWGPEPCGHPTLPGANIRTAAYSDWIVANGR